MNSGEKAAAGRISERRKSGFFLLFTVSFVDIL